MTHTFDGKIVLVTGAGSGMGLATAKAFAKAGARLVLADWNDAAVAAAAHELTEAGSQAISAVCDISEEGQVIALMERALSAYGRLDIAFNNAGVNRRRKIEIIDLDAEEWDRIITVNLRGTWLCMKHELRQMATQGSGVIVNCSSAAGLRGMAGAAAYVASKHGLIGLTKTAALEYAGRGIRVNAICPGPIDTPMMDQVTGGNPDILAAVRNSTPMGRMGTTEEIASAVLWLASSGAGFVTGHALVLDGGVSAR